ncbi:MAG: class I SAM-dependent methyltransferase [Candidatus Thalassarchaeaceae archaeon]|nr:class I SAM-dependent methyltransferase [Candidatus Thalassarchaeaceae archaeon]
MRPPTDVFSEWADMGKDAGMESGHAPAVQEILAAAFEQMDENFEFDAVDAGCGNGWVVRLLSSRSDCKSAFGVDGAESMIARAREIDTAGEYYEADLETWVPNQPVDLVHSMEVLYYLNDIPGFLDSVRSKWLRDDGIFAFGIDHYQENEACHDWSEKVGVRMAMHSESEWRDMVEGAGFEILRMFRASPREDWAGTLAIIARNCV